MDTPKRTGIAIKSSHILFGKACSAPVEIFEEVFLGGSDTESCQEVYQVGGMNRQDDLVERQDSEAMTESNGTNENDISQPIDERILDDTYANPSSQPCSPRTQVKQIKTFVDTMGNEAILSDDRQRYTEYLSLDDMGAALEVDLLKQQLDKLICLCLELIAGVELRDQRIEELQKMQEQNQALTFRYQQTIQMWAGRCQQMEEELYFVTSNRIPRTESKPSQELPTKDSTTAKQMSKKDSEVAKELSKKASKAAKELFKKDSKAAKELSKKNCKAAKELSKNDLKACKKLSSDSQSYNVIPSDSMQVKELSHMDSKPSREISHAESNPVSELFKANVKPATEISQTDSKSSSEMSQMDSTPGIEISLVDRKPATEMSQVDRKPDTEMSQMDSKPATEMSPVDCTLFTENSEVDSKQATERAQPTSKQIKGVLPRLYEKIRYAFTPKPGHDCEQGAPLDASGSDTKTTNRKRTERRMTMPSLRRIPNGYQDGLSRSITKETMGSRPPGSFCRKTYTELWVNAHEQKLL